MASPYQVNPQLTAIVQQFANDESQYVADKIFKPVPLQKRLYMYRKFDANSQYRIANDSVGPKSQIHEIENLPSTLITSHVKDYGLGKTLSWDESNGALGDIEYNVKATEVKDLSSVVLLSKEVRALKLAFDATQYSGAQSNGGVTDMTSTPITSSSDSVTLIKNILDTTKSRRFNKMVTSREVLSAMEMNIGFTLNGGGNVRISNPQLIAGILGLDDIYITDALYDASAAGLTPSLTRLIGKSILLYRDDSGRTAADGYQSTFGLQPTLHPMQAWEYFDEEVGLWGGTKLKAGSTHELLVLDRSLSHLFINVIP